MSFARGVSSAGVSPAFLRFVEIRKTVGGTSALKRTIRIGARTMTCTDPDSHLRC